MIIGNCVLAGNLSSWFLGEGYDNVPLLMMIMSIRFITSGFSEVLGTQMFIVIGKEKYPLIASFAAVIINIPLNILFIPLLGAIGAAISTAISEVILSSILIFFVIKGKYVSLERIFSMSLKYVFAGIIMAIPIYFLNKTLPYGVASFLLITVLGATVYFVVLYLIRDSFLCARLRDFKNIYLKKKY